jgi:hypothetical protein
MSVLAWLTLGKAPLPRTKHPVFGRIEATIALGDGIYFWETSEDLRTHKGPIAIAFDAKQDGPSPAQVHLWHWIYEGHGELAELARPLLLGRLNDFCLHSRLNDLVWKGVGLSVDGSAKSAWTMSFGFPLEESPLLTAYFQDGVPVTVSFDD